MLALLLLAVPVLSIPPVQTSGRNTSLCPPQPPSLSVGSDWDPALDAGYAAKSASRLSRAVQIATVSYDDMPSQANDSRWDPHFAFAKFLESEFPTVYATLKHEIINVHGHLYTWDATANMTSKSNSTKSPRPILLMAHEDVVPVNNGTLDQWTYPPFSGTIADGPGGKWIWGRGASDTKNTLIGILEAAEKLIAEGISPARPILISFGFDEEIGGGLGAGAISTLLQQRYGHDSMAFVVDEGFTGVQSNVYGATVASLGMQEKGSVSVEMSLKTLGGHSSSPLKRTGIGYMSRLVTQLEDNPFPATLNANEPFMKYLSCLSTHAPLFPMDLKVMVSTPSQWGALASTLDGMDDRVVHAFLATTTAVDLFNGGIKINALPEVVNASVNHRISFSSSVNATKQHYIDKLVPYAQRLGLNVTAFGVAYGTGTAGNQTTNTLGVYNDISVAGGMRRGTPSPAGMLNLRVTGDGRGLEPAPTTSTGQPFAFVAGTIKAVWGNNTIVAPSGMYANTDTARMWNLTTEIFRFTPAFLSESLNQHTVDERISLRAHLTTVRFYYKLMKNTQGWGYK